MPLGMGLPIALWWESTGALTINGAGTCQVVLTVEDSTDLDAASYVTNMETMSVTVAKASQTLTAPSDPYGSGVDLKVGQTPLAIANAPQGGEGTLVYASTDETVCTVGASDGLLTPVTPGSCTITAKWSGNEDYLASDGVTLFTTTIGNGVISVTDWGSYETVTVGAGSVSAPTISATPAGVGKSYSTTSADCEVDGNGAVTGLDDGTDNCEIQLALSQTHYDSTTHTYTISVQEGTMGALAAPAYAGTLAVRGTISVSSVPTGAPAGAAWAYTVVGKRNSVEQAGICSIVESTGRLSATADAEAGDVCEVTATASATGYADKAASVVSLTVSNRQSLDIAWTGYTPSTVTWVAGGPTAPALNGPSFSSGGNSVTSGINVSYAVGDGVTNCTVVESTGALTINGAGTCQVVLTVEDSTDLDEGSYVTNTDTATVTVEKASQTLTAPSDPYGSGAGLKVGQTPLAIANAPQGGEGSLVYASVDETVCTVGAGDGLLTPVAPGSCTVTAKWSGNEDYLASDGVTLFTTTIGNGVISVTDWGSYETVTVGAGSVSAPTISATPAGVGKSYSTTSADCEVDGNGAVTGLDDGTDNCEIQLALSQTHYDSTTHTYTISVQEGTLGALSAQGYTARLRVGGAAVPVTTNPAGAPAGVSATWSYTAVGKRSGVVTANICTVDTAGAVSPGTDARPNDTCEVTATLTATGYAAKSASTVTLTISTGLITVADWSGYGTVTVGAASVSAPSVTVTPTSVTKTYSTDFADCQVDGSTGVVTGLEDGTDNCVVELELSKTYYDSITHAYTISVSGGTMGALSAPVYDTNELVIGSAGASVTTPPAGAPDGAIWTYSVVGRRGGSAAPSHLAICVVSVNGNVILGADALPGDTCEVTASARSLGYASASADVVTFNILGKINLTWTGYDSSALRLDEAISLTEPTVTTNPAMDVTLTYSIHSSSQASDSRSEDPCAVDSSSGALTLEHRGSCVVELSASAVGYKGVSVVNSAITINKGDQGAPTWRLTTGSSPDSWYHYGAKNDIIKVGVPYSLIAPLDGEGHGPLVYESTVEARICTVESSTGTVTSWNPTDSCIIVAKWQGNEDWNASPVTADSISLSAGGNDGHISVQDWGLYSVARVGVGVQPPALVGVKPSNNIVRDWYLSGCTASIYIGVLTGSVAGEVCSLRLALSRNGFHHLFHTYTIPIIGTNDIGVSSWGSYPATVLPDAIVDAPDLIGMSPSDAAKEYSSQTPSICTVDSDTGRVTAGSSDGTCTIRLTLSRDTYTDQNRDYTFQVGTLTMGELRPPIYSIDNPAANTPYTPIPPLGAPAGSTVEYQVVEGSNGSFPGDAWSTSTSGTACQIDSSTGVLTFLESATDKDCRVRAIVRHTDYHDGTTPNTSLATHPDTQTKTILISSAGSYPSAIRMGENPVNAPTLRGVEPASVLFRSVYTLEPGSSGCTVTYDGTVTPTSTSGVCQVKLTLTAGRRYGYWEHTYSMLILGATEIGAYWGDYGKVLVGRTVAAPTLTGLAPSDATVNSYTSQTPLICSVDSDTGAVIGVAQGDCIVRLNLSAGGFTDKNHDYQFRVEPVSTWTSVTWAGYDSLSLTYGDSAPVLQSPSSAPAADSWSYSTTTPSVCNVDEASGALTINTAGTCSVMATPFKEDHDTDAGVTVSISIARQSQNAPVVGDWTGTPYGASPAVNAGEHLDIGATAPAGVEYDVTNTCTINATTGRVMGVRVGSCQVRARYAESDTHSASDWLDIGALITVNLGTQPAPYFWGPNPYGGSSASVKVNESLALGVSEPASVRASGGSLVYRIASGASFCSVDASTGEISGLRVGACTVEAYYEAVSDKYTASATAEVGVTVSVELGTQLLPGSWTGATPYGSGSVALGSTLAIGATAPTNSISDGGNLTYRIRQGADSCSINSTSGEVTGSAVGSCTVEAYFEGVPGQYRASGTKVMGTIQVQ